MGRISVPVQDLKDTATELKSVGDLISNSARLLVGGVEKSDVGDSTLADALDEFDKAWVAGLEKVQENVDVFVANSDKITENFTKTDDDSAKSLEDSENA